MLGQIVDSTSIEKLARPAWKGSFENLKVWGALSVKNRADCYNQERIEIRESEKHKDS
jgi:hypothetical protein